MQWAPSSVCCIRWSQRLECVALFAIFLLKRNGKPACWISSSAFQYETVGLLRWNRATQAPLWWHASHPLHIPGFGFVFWVAYNENKSSFWEIRNKSFILSNFQGLTSSLALLEKPLRLAKPGREGASLTPASPWEAGWPCCSWHGSKIGCMADDGIEGRVTRSQWLGKEKAPVFVRKGRGCV